MYLHAIALIYILAVMRVTRLVNFDTVLDPVRVRVAQRFGADSGVVHFLMCPWCVGFWVCALTVWIPMYFSHVPVVQYAGFVLAASHLIGLFAPLVADDDMGIEEVVAD